MKKLIIGIILIFLSINITNANYERNIDDDFNIYELEQKIGKIIERSNNQEILKSKLIAKVKIVLGKSKKELDSIGSFKNYNIKSFKEYIFIRIYRYLSYGDLIRHKDSKVKILENDFVRVLVTLPYIEIDNNSVYYLGNSGTKRKMIEFFKINSNDNTEDYINKNFLEKEYIGKCKTITKPEKAIFFTNSRTYHIMAFGDYISKEEEYYISDYDCGKYGANRSISYFERKSDNLLIYINAGQDYNGVDYSLIEFK